MINLPYWRLVGRFYPTERLAQWTLVFLTAPHANNATWFRTLRQTNISCISCRRPCLTLSLWHQWTRKRHVKMPLIFDGITYTRYDELSLQVIYFHLHYQFLWITQYYLTTSVPKYSQLMPYQRTSLRTYSLCEQESGFLMRYPALSMSYICSAGMPG